jgi:Uma2 family endonuclease
MPQIAPSRHLLTVGEYHQMGEAGILHEDSRIELIEGELIDMAPIGSSHAAAVNNVAQRISRTVEFDFVVSVQNPIQLDNHSEPQPDIMLLRPRADRYRSALPGAEDVLLLIEIADSSLQYDRNRKIPLYARHGIAEVWIVDLSGTTLERYRDPDPQTGTYRSIDQHRSGILQPQLLPQLELGLDAIW